MSENITKYVEQVVSKLTGNSNLIGYNASNGKLFHYNASAGTTKVIAKFTPGTQISAADIAFGSKP